MRIVQFRDKHSDPHEKLGVAEALRILCRRYNALLIINDDLELAEEVDADGLHIGAEDGEIPVIRKAWAGKILGVSCYGDLERAKWAAEAGADYLAFGSFFPSPTKPAAPVVPSRVLTAAGALGKPRCAIGGITAENGQTLVDAGAEMLAVISDLWNAPDITARAKQYAALWEAK